MNLLAFAFEMNAALLLGVWPGTCPIFVLSVILPQENAARHQTAHLMLSFNILQDMAPKLNCYLCYYYCIVWWIEQYHTISLYSSLSFSFEESTIFILQIHINQSSEASVMWLSKSSRISFIACIHFGHLDANLTSLKG